MRKVTIRFIMPVSPSVRPFACNDSDSTGKNCPDISYLRTFQKSVQKIQDSLKPGENGAYFMVICRWIILGIRNVSEKKIVRKIGKHTSCSITDFFFRKSCVCKIMWKNMVQPDRPRMTTWRMRFACWITKATNTHSECVIFIALPRRHWSRKYASILRSTYNACLVG